tara:strand:+ start:359 stop:709 length:351 start_codon:yes stop_codon:yes gene_type:complete
MSDYKDSRFAAKGSRDIINALASIGISAAQLGVDFTPFDKARAKHEKKYHELQDKFHRVLPDIDFRKAWTMANCAVFSKFGLDPFSVMNDWYRDGIHGKDMSRLFKDPEVQARADL